MANIFYYVTENFPLSHQRMCIKFSQHCPPKLSGADNSAQTELSIFKNEKQSKSSMGNRNERISKPL